MADKLSIKIKNVSVFSFAYNFALLGLIFGFIFGIFSSLIIKLLLSFTVEVPLSKLDALPFLAIMILCPILFAIFHFITGLFLGLFVNLVFKITGGLKINIEEDQILSKPSPAVPLKVEYPPLASSS